MAIPSRQMNNVRLFRRNRTIIDIWPLLPAAFVLPKFGKYSGFFLDNMVKKIKPITFVIDGKG
jgi:hypothetical protein